MVRRRISHVPGLYEIFKDIVFNTLDNKYCDPTMDSVKLSINIEENVINVYNNGDGGIEVEEIHTEKGSI